MRTAAAVNNKKPNMTKSNFPTIVMEQIMGTRAENESHLSQYVLKIQNRPSCIRAIFCNGKTHIKTLVISAHVRYGKVEHLNQTFFLQNMPCSKFISKLKGFTHGIKLI